MMSSHWRGWEPMRLGGLLDCLRSPVHIGKLERWVPTSLRESAAAATGQMNSSARVNTKKAKKWSLPSPVSFYLGGYQKVPTTFGEGLPRSIKAIKTISIRYAYRYNHRPTWSMQSLIESLFLGEPRWCHIDIDSTYHRYLGFFLIFFFETWSPLLRFAM